MKVSLYSTCKECTDLGTFNIAHVTMFDKQELQLHFGSDVEQSNFMNTCVKHYVLFKVQGKKVIIIPENNNFQRVRFRFDA